MGLEPGVAGGLRLSQLLLSSVQASLSSLQPRCRPLSASFQSPV